MPVALPKRKLYNAHFIRLSRTVCSESFTCSLGDKYNCTLYRKPEFKTRLVSSCGVQRLLDSRGQLLHLDGRPDVNSLIRMPPHPCLTPTIVVFQYQFFSLDADLWCRCQANARVLNTLARTTPPPSEPIPTHHWSHATHDMRLTLPQESQASCNLQSYFFNI